MPAIPLIKYDIFKEERAIAFKYTENLEKIIQSNNKTAGFLLSMFGAATNDSDMHSPLPNRSMLSVANKLAESLLLQAYLQTEEVEIRQEFDSLSKKLTEQFKDEKKDESVAKLDAITTKLAGDFKEKNYENVLYDFAQFKKIIDNLALGKLKNFNTQYPRLMKYFSQFIQESVVTEFLDYLQARKLDGQLKNPKSKPFFNRQLSYFKSLLDNLDCILISAIDRVDNQKKKTKDLASQAEAIYLKLPVLQDDKSSDDTTNDILSYLTDKQDKDNNNPQFHYRLERRANEIDLGLLLETIPNSDFKTKLAAFIERSIPVFPTEKAAFRFGFEEAWGTNHSINLDDKRLKGNYESHYQAGFEAARDLFTGFNLAERDVVFNKALRDFKSKENLEKEKQRNREKNDVLLATSDANVFVAKYIKEKIKASNPAMTDDQIKNFIADKENYILVDGYNREGKLAFLELKDKKTHVTTPSLGGMARPNLPAGTSSGTQSEPDAASSTTSFMNPTLRSTLTSGSHSVVHSFQDNRGVSGSEDKYRADELPGQIPSKSRKSSRS